ncbi:hypothetical protein Peur_009924 [Populus x canadensis]
MALRVFQKSCRPDWMSPMVPYNVGLVRNFIKKWVINPSRSRSTITSFDSSPLQEEPREVWPSLGFLYFLLFCGLFHAFLAFNCVMWIFAKMGSL